VLLGASDVCPACHRPQVAFGAAGLLLMDTDVTQRIEEEWTSWGITMKQGFNGGCGPPLEAQWTRRRARQWLAGPAAVARLPQQPCADDLVSGPACLRCAAAGYPLVASSIVLEGPVEFKAIPDVSALALSCYHYKAQKGDYMMKLFAWLRLDTNYEATFYSLYLTSGLFKARGKKLVANQRLVEGETVALCGDSIESSEAAGISFHAAVQHFASQGLLLLALARSCTQSTGGLRMQAGVRCRRNRGADRGAVGTASTAV
jgi:hypothetical protein